MKFINVLLLAASASAFNLRNVLDNVDNFLRDDTSNGQSNNELRRPTQISSMGPPPLSRPNTGYGGYRSMDDDEEKVNRVTRYLRSDPLALKAVSAFVERMGPEERSYSTNNAPTGNNQRPNGGDSAPMHHDYNGGYTAAPYPQNNGNNYNSNDRVNGGTSAPMHHDYNGGYTAAPYPQNNGGTSAPAPHDTNGGYTAAPYPSQQAYRSPDSQDGYGKVTRALRNLINNLDQEL